MSDLRGDMVGWLRARATERRLRDINMVGEENVRSIEGFADWQIANEIARLREHNADLVKLSHLETEANKKLRSQLVKARETLASVAYFMRKDVQSGDSNLWTPEYEELHDEVIVALAALTDETST